MKALLTMSLVLAVSACAYSPDRRYGDDRYDRYGKDHVEDGAQGHDKVLVCHKGKTMSLPRAALDGHMKHGDRRGPC